MKKIISIILLSTLLFACSQSSENGIFSSFTERNRDNINIYYSNERTTDGKMNLKNMGVSADQETEVDEQVIEIKNNILGIITEISSLEREVLTDTIVTNEGCTVLKTSENSDYVRLCSDGNMVFSNSETRETYKFTSEDYTSLYEELDKNINSYDELITSLVSE